MNAEELKALCKAHPSLGKFMVKLHEAGKKENAGSYSGGILLWVVFISFAISGTVTHYFTRQVYEHKVDSRVLEMIKDPSRAAAVEAELENLLAKEVKVKQEYETLNKMRNDAVAEMNQANQVYFDVKQKMLNEKIIYEEAYQESISNLKAQHAKEIEEARADAHSEGVGSGVIGTLGVQMLLED